MSQRTPRSTSSATFRVYLEATDTDIVWWADTDAVPGLSLAAPTLRALRTLVEEAARRHIGLNAVVALDLVVYEHEADQGPVASSEILPSLPIGEKVRSALIYA